MAACFFKKFPCRFSLLKKTHKFLHIFLCQIFIVICIGDDISRPPDEDSIGFANTVLRSDQCIITGSMVFRATGICAFVPDNNGSGPFAVTSICLISENLCTFANRNATGSSCCGIKAHSHRAALFRCGICSYRDGAIFFRSIIRIIF